MDEKLKDKIIEIIANHSGIDSKDFYPEADFVRDLNIKRIEIPDIFMAIETELKIKLPQDKIQEIETVEDLINLVSDRLL